MQYLVIGKDGKDKKASERRMAAREAHHKLGDEMETSGERWYGCVLLDDNGKRTEKNRIVIFKQIENFICSGQVPDSPSRSE